MAYKETVSGEELLHYARTQPGKEYINTLIERMAADGSIENDQALAAIAAKYGVDVDELREAYRNGHILSPPSE